MLFHPPLFALLCCPLFYSLSTTALENQIYSLHGSGTTNPNLCFWDILDKLSSQSKLPLKLTYRGVGSTVGVQEIINNNTKDSAPVYFASADLPLTTTEYNDLNTAEVQVRQLPILLGTVSVFHSADVYYKPNDSNDDDATPPPLQLSPCVLAKIYTQKITTWNDPEILALNTNLADNAGDIIVSVRNTGSSSTWALTNYLNIACPEDFPAESTGTLPTWPDNFQRCQGNAGMVECVQAKPGAIAYIESGHGNNAGLPEVLLANAEGQYLTSTVSAEHGGISSAETSAFPSTAEDDFGNVNLLYRPGAYTWPMVIMTYVFVRNNVTYFDDPTEQALLIAFLRMLQMPEYVTVCQEQYGFVLPGDEATTLTKNGIDALEGDIMDNLRWQSGNYTPFTFETTPIQPITGMGDHVISINRGTIDQTTFVDLTGRVTDLETLVQTLQEKLNAADDVVQSAQLAQTQYAEYTYRKDSQLKAAVVLSSLAFSIGIVLAFVMASQWLFKP